MADHWSSRGVYQRPMTNTLHPDATGENLTLTGDLDVAVDLAVGGDLDVGDDAVIQGGLTVGSSDAPLNGQIKFGTSGGAGYLTAYGGGAYIPGHLDATELFFEISGVEALKLLSTGHFRIKNNKLFKSLNAAGNADLDLIGRNSSDALILGSGLTGIVKVVSSVISAAGILNADVQSGAAITPDKLSGPLFSYYRAASDNNVTGNGTVYTCLFDTAVISNANYATGTGVFTAPAAGKYLFVGKVGVASGSSGGTQGEVNIVTTGRSYRHDFNPYGNRHTASGVASMPFAVIASMAQNDTAKVTLTVTGDGSNIADFIGGAFSDFAGWRVG